MISTSVKVLESTHKVDHAIDCVLDFVLDVVCLPE